MTLKPGRILLVVFVWMLFVATTWALVSADPHRRIVARVPMPPKVVLITCKTQVVGEPDANAEFTGAETREWVIEHGLFSCRRVVVDIPWGDSPWAFGPRCAREAVIAATTWDQEHKRDSYRVWRVACPTPVARRAGDHDEIFDWTLPDCGHRETITCDNDIEI